MSEEWSWGVQKFTEEEQRAYDQKVGAVTGGNYEQPDNGYYSGEMGDEPARNEPQAPIDNGRPGAEEALQGIMGEEQPVSTEPQPSTHFLADPTNFMDVWNRYDQDPGYEDPNWTRTQMDTLYSVYSHNNPGATPDQWKPLMDNDPFVTDVLEKDAWYDPVREEQAKQQAQQTPTAMESAEQLLRSDETKQGWFDEKATRSWDQLDWIAKLTTAIGGNASSLSDAPAWLDKSQAGFQALNSAMSGPIALQMLGGLAGSLGAGGVAAAVTNPYVLAGAALAVGGLAFYQAVSGKEIPVFSKFLELSDIKDTVVEHSIGYAKQAYDIGKGYVTAANADKNDAYGLLNAINDTIKDVGEHSSAMWKAGEYTYEMYGSVGDFAIDALKEIFKGEEGTKTGEGWFFNRGLNEKQQLAEGTYGGEGMSNIRQMYEMLSAAGYDDETANALVNQLVSEAGGSSAFVSDFAAQMLMDVDFMTTPIENNTAGFISRLAGDQRGVEAAKINSGSILTQLPVIGNLVQGIGNTISPGSLKAPGGIMEWMDIRKNLARSADVNTLSAADRFFGGINTDGTIKDFARVEKTGLADQLPESKVAGVGNIANNVMNAYMADVKDTNDIRNRLASMVGEADAATEYDSGMNNSADVLTVRDGLKHAINDTNPEIILRQFDESANARSTLQKTADALGMQVKDVLSLYSEKPAVFEQLVRDNAAKNNGMFAGIDVTNGVDPVSTIVRGFTTAKDGKGTPLDWDIRQVQYRITTSLIDNMAKYYTEYYGVKPNSTINTIFDTMKSAQSLLLLGWSPSYFINNVINNAVTSAAEGVLGFMTPKQINRYMSDFGVSPARMGIDLSAEFRGQTAKGGQGGLEAFTNAASEAKKAGTDKGLQGALTGINGILHKANDKLGVFSSMSGIMETLQGNILTTVAIQQYWGRRWKRGEGFHLMSNALVDAIEAQTPGMTNVIYQAIENGLNMDQVKKVLLQDTDYIHPDVGTVMKQLVENLNRGEANVYEEMFEKSGIMRELKERYANCKTDAERQAVIDSVTKRLDEFLTNMRREDLIQRANNTAAIVEGEGLAPVSQMLSEMEMNHAEFWVRIRNEWTDYYTKIMNEKMDFEARQTLLGEMITRHQKEWADLYKQEASTAAGIMKGLGFQNESLVKYIGLMNEKNQNWQKFNDLKEQELGRAYERTGAIYAAAEQGKADQTKIAEVWDDFHRNVSELYDQHFDREQECQRKMDAAFIEGYEFSTGKSGEQLQKNFDRINEIRKQMHDMQQQAHEKTKDLNAEDKAKYYQEFNPKYNALIREIGNLGEANAQIINDTAENVTHTYENHAPVSMTPEQTVAATETMDTNNAVRDKAMRERKGYLDREGIQQAWIENGRTPAEADLMMTVYDAMANQWAKDNGAYPDEYYSQALRLKGIASWLGEDIKDLNPNILNQSSDDFWNTPLGQKLIKKTLTPEFESWFRKSVRKDEAGRPQRICHGSPALFFKFIHEAAGSKTGKQDTKDVFFFSKDFRTASSYGSNDPIWHRVGDRFFAYLEGREVPGGETNLWEQTRITSLSTPTIEDVRIIYDNYSDLLLLLNQYPIEQNVNDTVGVNVENVKKELQTIIDKGTVDATDIEYIRRAYFLDDSIRYAFGDTSRESSIKNNGNDDADTGLGYVYEGYLRQENPLTVDYDSEEHIQFMVDHEFIDEKRNVIYSDHETAIKEGYVPKYENGIEATALRNEWDGVWQAYKIEQARATGHDGVEFLNIFDSDNKNEKILTTTYAVFEPNQFKSIWNDGNFNNADNFLHQDLQNIVKGTFEHTDIGNIIRMLEASDVSTMVHESGHLFRRTLSQPLMQEFTTWAGFESVAEFQELEARWQKNDPTLTEDEKTRYVEAEEKFARGFEQYLMDGSAPTPGLKAVFKQFRDYLLDIYQKVKTTVTGNDYSQQGEFIFHGKTGDEVLNINAEINGVKLRDIFDRMLTDDVQRTPGYAELVQNLKSKLELDRHNMRMSRDALSRRAQVEVTRTILQNFGSMEAAEAALQNYDLPMEINGWRVDDATLYEAINAAKADAQMNPFAQVDHHEVKGTNTYAYSITGANSGKKYQLQYKVVELNDLIASDTWMGNQLVINENYPADVQARHRSADSSDVYAHAANLNPGLLIDEQRAIDSGAPIVGEGNLYVESGNGRVLSLQYAKENFPEQWANYQEYLRNSVGDYGIDPQQLDGFENPVLIRERLGGDRVSFAEDANSNRNKGMTASENALTDANKVNMETLGNLDIQPGEGIDTFTTEKNAQPAVEWLRSLPEMERNRYSTTNRSGDLILSADGKTRFTNALFATLYATPESMEIIRSFSETADSSIQALESALKQTLPEMARAEGLIRSGSRAGSLSITGDVMAAAGLLQEARKAGINIHDYLAQQTIPGFERWTETQALLAGFFGDAKNNVRMLKDFFNAYGEEVYKSGDPNQLSLFSESKTREQMIDDSITAAMNRRSREVTNPEGGILKTSADETPRLNQSVLDSEDRWSSEFAKVLDENLQRTFDDGMNIPLDQADSVFLRGDVDTRYETMVQRWLRDFSNEKNLSADQYLYAWDYFEWWVQGSNGDAPKGNPVWEADVQKMVIQDFTKGEHANTVNELQRRYKKGAEIDPTAVPNQGEYFKRTYHFTHGYWDIAGNVYKDGKLIAYLPEQLSKMKRSIEVDGQSYKVLGIDLKNPDGLVYFDPVLEITRTVVAGKPEGFDEPRNAFAFMRPVKQGATPQTMPVADAYTELAQKYLYPALNKFGEAYKQADADAKTRSMNGLDLNTRMQLLQWLDQDVTEDMRAEKYRAIKYSDMKKDAAMLNYNQRYGFDPLLTMINPYQFWYTRSMWKWAKRMVDKPALGNAYQRMKEYEDRNRQENLPSRLAGRWRIPMAFLPDWMGGSYYVDLYAQLFPFSQFGQSYGNNMNQATLNARAKEILAQQQQNGEITVEQLNEAVEKKDGEIWAAAYSQAETEIGKSDGINTLVNQLYSPNIFTTWYFNKQNGENPNLLSGTRTGNAIKALTQDSDIPLVSKIGSTIGDVMTLPERKLRELYGFDYNEFGAYGDQAIRKQISQMIADGDVNNQEGLNAMVEKSGTIWDMAADRQRKEAELKVPGFAGAEAAKAFVKGNASLGETIGTVVASLLGGGAIYPEGEKSLREMKALRDQACIDEENGIEGAVSKWYDKYGDIYASRTATYMNDPEELTKFVLFENISRQYWDASYQQRYEIERQLGPEFYYALFNKETKNYQAVTIQQLADWNAAIGGKNPDIGSIDVKGVERVMQMSEQAVSAIDEYDTIKEERFPGIGVIQNGYFALPKQGPQRKQYLQEFPQLEDYWTWNRTYKEEHSEVGTFSEHRSEVFNNRTCYESYAVMSEYTMQQLDLAKATKGQLSDIARRELENLYKQFVDPRYTTLEEYIKMLQDYE